MQPNEKPYPRVLTIAGSDSGGGAGIQADLKTFGALSAYGASVITAVTAQNTQGVQAVHTVPSDIIRAQCESVFTDIRIDAVKIGMLPHTETIRTVAAAKSYLHGALDAGQHWHLGHGNGPVAHFWRTVR